MSRRSSLALALLTLGCLSALGFGLFGLLAPTQTAAAVSLQPQNSFALGEIRAIYGGLWLATGLVLAATTLHLGRTLHRTARVPVVPVARIQTIAWCWVGLPAGRSLGLLLDGGAGGPALGFLLGELAMLASLLGGLTLLPRARA